MRILIIGGTGVLGSAIASAALQSGCEVTIVSNGRGPAFKDDDRYVHAVVDRDDPMALSDALNHTGITRWDLVVDVICYNARHANDLLAIIGNCADHVVVVSSAILYDHRCRLPFRPQDSIAPPAELGPYGIGKAAMERCWLDSEMGRNRRVTILRLPHVLGEGCSLGAVPLHNRDPSLLWRMRGALPLFLADGGRQVLQVVYNEDVARVVLAVLERRCEFGGIFNCANPEIITGRRYFETLGELLGVTPIIESVPVEAIWNSGWGWGLTTIPRLLDLESLHQAVGFVPSTPARSALETSLAFALGHEVYSPRASTDYLSKLSTAIHDGNARVAKTLLSLMEARPQSNVDTRMNHGWPG